MRDEYERFEAANLQVVAIGQGSPDKTKAFRAELELPFPLLSDPRRSAYKAYGLTRVDMRREASIKGISRSIKSTLKYGAARSSDQDMLQLGGAFVVNTDGIICFAHRSSRMSDIPSNEMLLAAVR